jgi:NAD(P)-dependent dehydrogenase (short-subunit alcohol dehydrogenase family)
MPSTLRAVVTGAGSGLGRAFCRELCRRGARVLASDVSLELAERTVASVRQLGGTAYASECDVSQLANVQALAASADTHLGGADLLINNAGVGVSGRVGEVPIDDWTWLMSINLWGAIHGCHVFVPRFRVQRSGAVLNVASAAGLLAPPELAAYNVSKAGIIALSETLSQELAEDGISVTVLSPTFFRSNFIGASRSHNQAMLRLGELLVQNSRLNTDRIARTALDAVASGRLHVLVGAQGRWLWRLKRLVPEGFTRRLAPLLRRCAECFIAP